MDIEATVKDLLSRVVKLETFLSNSSPEPIGKNKNFTGATGGLRLLAQNKFFDKKRRLADVTTELQSRGYHYSRQAIQIGLTRLSKKGGQLVCLDEKGAKYYATRR